MENFKIGDNVKKTGVFYKISDTFMGGKLIEEIIKIDTSNEVQDIKLWLTNGKWVNPLMVEKIL